MNEITFFVEGEPRPKQSFRVSGKNGGYQPARVKAWQTDVAIAAQDAMRKLGRFNEPLQEQLSVSLLFFLGNNRRVDIDNLSKAVLDGLNGIVFQDDQQVVELSLRKLVIGHPDETAGVHVAIANSEMTA